MIEMFLSLPQDKKFREGFVQIVTFTQADVAPAVDREAKGEKNKTNCFLTLVHNKVEQEVRSEGTGEYSVQLHQSLMVKETAF